MPTGLSKTVLEIPFKGGLTEKIHADMAQPDGLYVLENVELEKSGAFKRRPGYEVMTNAIIGSVSTIGTPKKVAGRQEELFIITEDLGFLGSGGGGGASGATLWTYSPEADGWRDTGKVSSLTVERFSGLANGQPALKSLDCSYCVFSGSEFVVLAYTEGTFASANAGCYVAVYDVTSRSMVLEPTIVDATDPAFTGKVQVVSVGQYAVVLFRSAAIGAANLNAVVYDADTNTVSPLITIFSASAKAENDLWCASTDGTNLFIAFKDSTNISVQKFTVGATSITGGSVASVAATVSYGVWLSNGGGILSVTWSHFTVGIKYWAVTISSMTQVAAPITHSTENDASSRTYSTHLSSSEVVVFWDRDNTGGTTDYSVMWRWVKTVTTAPASRANSHRSPGVQVIGAPFVFNSRVFCPLIGMSSGNPAWENDNAPTQFISGTSNFGHCICEVNSNGSAEDVTTGGNKYLTFLPVAAWGRDISRYALPGLGGFGGGSDRYMATIRQSRVSDFVQTDNENATAHVSLWSIDVMRVQFADPKRWHHAEGNASTVLAGALPYVYDGMNAHECGYVFRPAVMAITEAATGDFQPNDVVLYKVVYEWEDVRGGRWFSDTSITATYTVIGVSQALTVKIRVPSISAKPLGGFQFTGRIKINLYRADPEAPDDFRLVHTDTFMIFDGSGNPIVAFHTIVDDGTVDIESNERAYIFGNELNNACMPPCRSVVQHRDRLFCIDTEDNYLWYTKPFARGRGFEWAREQRLPLPSRGMALASVEGSLLVYNERQVLVLEGQGPGPTGQPTDAYSRLMVLSQDQGCSEINAAWRFPGASIFRSFQGIWSVTGNLGLGYVGAAVEDTVRDALRFIDGNVDESKGCLALLATDGTSYSILRLWYDSGRWSRDTFSAGAVGTAYSSLFHRGDFYIASTEGMLKRSPHLFRDGGETLDEVYLAAIQTGRYRLDSLASFKRLWRTLGMVRSDDDETAVGLGAPRGPGLDVAMSVTTQGPVDGETEAVFSGEELGGGVPKTLRLHVKHQKGQSYRFRLEERRTLDTKLATRGPFGYTFLGLGLEIGMKRGAAKQPGGRSL